jgi:hypothetical protein
VDPSLCTALGLPQHADHASQAPTGARTRRRPVQSQSQDETTRQRAFRQAFFLNTGSDGSDLEGGGDAQANVPLNVGSDTATDADSDSEVTQTGSDPQVKVLRRVVRSVPGLLSRQQAPAVQRESPGQARAVQRQKAGRRCLLRPMLQRGLQYT